MTAEGQAAQAAIVPGNEEKSLASLLATLRDPAVRDLAWLLLSADLLRPQLPVGVLADPFDIPERTHATLAWLTALDATPETLHRDLASTRITRLGRYAERLLGWFLQHGPAARLVAAGVQVRQNGITLGECDFLLQTQQGTPLHWELAVKCYLHAGGAEQARLGDYVGPNLKDRFDLKLAHLLNHQLPLSSGEAFVSLGYAGPWTPQMFIKGWLFYRHGETPVDAVELDPSHDRGWWVTHSGWPAFAATHAQYWRTLPRLEWLAPRRYEAATGDGSGQESVAQSGAGTVVSADREAVATATKATPTTHAVFVDASTLVSQIRDRHEPAMVAAFIQDSAGNWVERSRGFIVPDEWPGRARAYARQ